jgi:hypothetical protein
MVVHDSKHFARSLYHRHFLPVFRRGRAMTIVKMFRRFAAPNYAQIRRNNPDNLALNVIFTVSKK